MTSCICITRLAAPWFPLRFLEERTFPRSSVIQGFTRIQNLEEYTGLKVIWLEGNGLTVIEGLDAQAELSTLYLQENLIERIEGVSRLTNLNTLNLTQVCAKASCQRVRVCLCVAAFW